MRTMLSCLFVSGTLLGTTSCERTKDPDEKVEAARDQVQEQREDVREQREDVRDEAKDMRGETKELSEAEAELGRARAQYIAQAKERIQELEGRINALETKGDLESKATATRLRQQTMELQRQFESADTRTATGWEQFKEGADQKFDEVERDLDEAT